MSDTIWVLEYRTRERRNGKWSEWAPCEHSGRPAEAYREFPTSNVFSYEKYERRAVEYVRLETSSAPIVLPASSKSL